jgi:hypothetical protein
LVHLLFNLRVIRLKAIVSLLTLTLWMSCTAHCALEMTKETGQALARHINTKIAVDSGQIPGDSHSCVCSWMQSGGYHCPENISLAVSPEFILLSVLPLTENSLTGPALPKVIFSPPELPANWRFSLRTASPPRAPSFIA